MKFNQEAMAMLDIMVLPAFCVKNGKIVYVNHAAKQHLIVPDTDIAELIHTGLEEYNAFCDGCLYLNLHIFGAVCSACVTKNGDFDVFVLDNEADNAELKALLLASTELRQPLNSVLTAVDNLFPAINADSNPNIQKQISYINRGLFQLLRIICNMSDAASYIKSSGNFALKDIGKVMASIFESLQAYVSHTQVQLHFTNITETIFTLVDEEKLERAVHNIISNALKFTPKGGRIDVTFLRRNKKLYLTVQDSGENVPPELRSSVFNRYLREPGLEDSRLGVGLGFVLIRSAAAIHSGTVLVEYPQDAGMRITLTMQITQDSQCAVRDVLTGGYTGGRDTGLIELSEVLPAELYRKDNIN